MPEWTCCMATCKEECNWPPCPCNLECWTGAELVELMTQDAGRVDDAIEIYVNRELRR